VEEPPGDTDFLKWEMGREISVKHEDETLCSAQQNVIIPSFTIRD
jgi:hypothetical protein